MRHLRAIAMWMVAHVPLGNLTPHVLAFALGARVYRRRKDLE
jgi:hypothetical protein